VPNAVPEGSGSANLEPLGVAGRAAHLDLAPIGTSGASPTSVSLFDQGLVQVLEASVTGLEPGRSYVLALASHSDGSGELLPLSAFMTNPAGAAIVNTVGPIRQLVQGEAFTATRYLVIAAGTVEHLGLPVQVERAEQSRAQVHENP
jgi:hypothetical protein